MTSSKLGTDKETGQLVYLPKAARIQGLYIVGLQGMGKSGLISNLVIEDIKQGTGVCVLDPKRDLIDSIIARLPSDREKDVILLDVADEEYPFGLNLFACPNLKSTRAVQIVIDQVMHIFEKLLKVSEETQLILEYLINCTITLVANQDYTMAEIPLLLTNKSCREKLVANVNTMWGDSWGIDVLGFWEQYEQKQLGRQSEEIASILRRVRRLLQPVIRPFVGQTQTTIDLQQIMDERKILLVKLDRQMPQVTTIIGSILVALILKASAARQTQRQFHLYADEFQRFATDDFATLLEEARYAAIGITMAHQNRAQLEASDKRVEEKLKDRTLNVGSLVVFYVPTDAEELAGQFDTTPPPAWEEELEEEQLEIREQERLEMMEVIDGEEELEEPVKDVVGHLLKRGSHPTSDVVNEFATETLGKLNADRQARKSEIDTHFHILNTLLYDAMVHKRFDTPLPIETLYYFMVRIEKPYTFGTYPILFKNDPDFNLEGINVLWTEQPGTPLWQQWISYHDRTVRDRIYKRKLFMLDQELDHIGSCIWYYTVEEKEIVTKWEVLRTQEVVPSNLAPQEIIANAKSVWYRLYPEETWFSLDVDTYDKVRALLLKSFPGRLDENTRKEFRERQREYFYNPADLDRVVEEELQEQKTIFLNFIQELKEVMQALADKPIYAGSGIRQPRKRQQILLHPEKTFSHPRVAITHPQPTSAEMEKKNENQLLQLDLYQAWVKMIKNDPQNPGKECMKCGLRNANGARSCIDCNTKLPAPNEYLIETLEPEKGLYGKLLQERVNRIQAQNRKPDQFGHVYCRPIKEVEAEIAQRQSGCSGSAPAQAQTQQQHKQTRHARNVPVQRNCPDCGSVNASNAMFCNQCGAKLK